MKIRLAKLCALFIGAALVALAVYQGRQPQAAALPAEFVAPQPEATQTNQLAPPAPAPPAAPPVVVKNDSFQRHPFRAVIELGAHGWTAEDGRDTNVIAQLAHNNLEYQNMVDENVRIHQRQLVYRNDPVAAVMQRAKLTGEPVNRIVLPGLDGMEFDVVITARDLAPSSQIGTLSGYVEGLPDSLVTVAYKFGREAFTIEFPGLRYGLQGDPREPGEVIVKSFETDVYTQGAICGNDKEPSVQDQ